jgi:hypothetical protein
LTKYNFWYSNNVMYLNRQSHLTMIR